MAGLRIELRAGAPSPYNCCLTPSSGAFPSGQGALHSQRLPQGSSSFIAPSLRSGVVGSKHPDKSSARFPPKSGRWSTPGRSGWPWVVQIVFDWRRRVRSTPPDFPLLVVAAAAASRHPMSTGLPRHHRAARSCPLGSSLSQVVMDLGSAAMWVQATRSNVDEGAGEGVADFAADRGSSG